MNTATGFVPLTTLGNTAVHAVKMIRERDGIPLPKPSRIYVKLSREGKYTTALVKAGRQIAAGVAARNPDDRDVPLRGNMTALVRALRHIGRQDNQSEENR